MMSDDDKEILESLRYRRNEGYDHAASARRANGIRSFILMSKEEREKHIADRKHAYKIYGQGTPEERLAYYRSHGLVNCDDYPGGDKQFELDVLSGAQRDESIYYGDMKNEDAYIIKTIQDGRFKLDDDFRIHFTMRPHVMLAVYDALDVRMNYLGGPVQLREDILSGRYGMDQEQSADDGDGECRCLFVR